MYLLSSHDWMTFWTSNILDIDLSVPKDSIWAQQNNYSSLFSMCNNWNRRERVCTIKSDQESYFLLGSVSIIWNPCWLWQRENPPPLCEYSHQVVRLRAIYISNRFLNWGQVEAYLQLCEEHWQHNMPEPESGEEAALPSVTSQLH